MPSGNKYVVLAHRDVHRLILTLTQFVFHNRNPDNETAAASKFDFIIGPLLANLNPLARPYNSSVFLRN